VVSGPPRHVNTTVVGRAPELERIASFLDEAAVGGQALLVSGDAGVGKTAMLDLAAQAAGSKVRVARAAGAEFEAGLSFAGLSQVLQPLLRGLDELSVAHREALSVALGLGIGSAPGRLLLSAATLELVCRAARDAPLLMIVDDLQWVDRPTLEVLGFVARRLAGSPIGFLASLRSDMAGYFDHAGLPLLELGALGPVAASEVLERAFPDMARGVRQRVLAEAQGNPLALLELPAALTASQLAAHEPLPAALPLSARLQALFESRVSDLPAATREAVLLAALDGTGELAPLRSSRGDAVLTELAPAEEARLLRLVGAGRLAFRHPLTRAAVVGMSTSGERRLAHRALGAAWSAHPERSAWHRAEAALGPDEEVAELLEQAAHRLLQRGDPQGAVAALARSADLSPGAVDRRRRLAEAAVIGANVTADSNAVSRLLSSAQDADPHGTEVLPAATASAAVLFNLAGDVDTAQRLLGGAIDDWLERPDLDEGHLVAALLNYVVVCSFGGRSEVWGPFDKTIDRLGPRVPTVARLWIEGFADPARTSAASLHALDSAIARLQDSADPFEIIPLSMPALYTDRISGLRAHLERLADSARQGGAVYSGLAAMFQLGIDDFHVGRWDEAVSLAEEGLALSLANDYGLVAQLFRYCRALIAAARGEDETVRALTDGMARWAAPRRIGLVHHLVCHARALSALGRGDFELAYDRATAISPPGSVPRRVPVALRVMLDVVESGLRTGRGAEATAHAMALRDAGIAAISPRLAMLVRGAMAIVSDDHTAVGLFEQALAVPGAGAWPFDRARIELCFGERLRRARSGLAARRHLSAALDTFELLGAEPWSARAAKELRATGVAAEPGSQCGPGSLTAQEAEVVALAASGLTNKQIAERLYVSHHTVAAHLYRAFPKLGITSRAALRDALEALPQPGAPTPG
jgi:DNA-binding CsgD family transcriptional regulator